MVLVKTSITGIELPSRLFGPRLSELVVYACRLRSLWLPFALLQTAAIPSTKISTFSGSTKPPHTGFGGPGMALLCLAGWHAVEILIAWLVGVVTNWLAALRPPHRGMLTHGGRPGDHVMGLFATFNSAFLFLVLQSVLCIFSFDWKQGSSKKCSEWPRIPHFCPSDALELFISHALYIACREVVTLVPCMCRLKRVHVSAQQFNFGLL